MGWVMTFNKAFAKAHRTRGLTAFLKEATNSAVHQTVTSCCRAVAKLSAVTNPLSKLSLPKVSKKTISEGFAWDGSHILYPPVFAYFGRTGYLTHIRPVLEVIRQG